MEVMLRINKKWLLENMDKFVKAYNAEEYTEEQDYGKELQIEVDFENCEYTIKDTDKMEIQGGDDNLWISANDEPKIEDLLNLATVITKYYNKAKACFESVK